MKFFAEKNLKVTDVSCGEHHTLVVTDNGEVWSFGFGGSHDFTPMDWLMPRTGALGSGSTLNRLTPGLVSGVSKPKKMTSGDRFAFAVNDKGEVVSWGCGDDGALADGACEGVLTP